MRRTVEGQAAGIGAGVRWKRGVQRERAKVLPPVDGKMGRVKLVAFDLDGTLIRGDTACLAIARQIGKYDRMLEFEDCDTRDCVVAARQEMARWYMESGKRTVTEACGRVAFAPGAMEAVAALHASGVETVVLSMTWSFAVERVAAKLGIGQWAGTSLDFESGEIEHFWAADKAAWLRRAMEDRGLASSEVAAVGDSAGDFPMLELAGTGVFVGGANPAISGVRHMPAADLKDVSRFLMA